MTKGELAERILKMLGVNTRFSEASPEEVADVLRYTEDWMTANSAVGRRIGWAESDDNDPDPGDDTGIPGWAVMGVTASVAMMCAPYFGKEASPTIARNAAMGMATITNRTIEIQPVQYPGRMPRGSVQRGPHGPRFYHPEDRIITHNDFLSDEGDDPITS